MGVDPQLDAGTQTSFDPYTQQAYSETYTGPASVLSVQMVPQGPDGPLGMPIVGPAPVYSNAGADATLRYHPDSTTPIFGGMPGPHQVGAGVGMGDFPVPLQACEHERPPPAPLPSLPLPSYGPAQGLAGGPSGFLGF